MTRVVMVLSAAQFWELKDGTKHPTGFWAEEFVVPYETFKAAGFEVDIATPGAKKPVVDELSLGLGGGLLPKAAKDMRQRVEALRPVYESPIDLYGVDPEEYDLMFYPGGHGPMQDLAYDPISGEILNKRLASHKPLALLCHAPAALVATVDSAGNTLFAGRRVTALSDIEERVNPFAWKAKWLVEDKLKEIGMKYSKGFPFRPYVVRDKNLFTGQNPQSSKRLAETLVTVLND